MAGATLNRKWPPETPPIPFWQAAAIGIGNVVVVVVVVPGRKIESGPYPNRKIARHSIDRAASIDVGRAYSLVLLSIFLERSRSLLCVSFSVGRLDRVRKR